jgi:hypothetical protein
MEMQTALQPRSHEQRLISIVRKLPTGRLSQVIDFARFIEWQVSVCDDLLDDSEESEEEIRASEEKWDRLFAKPEAQRLMMEMAREALVEHDAGLTVEMVFDEDGNLIV